MSQTLHIESTQTAETDGPLAELFNMLDSGIDKHAGDAARQHLAEGRPVYYSEHDTPKGRLIREWPNGTRELVDVDIKTGVIKPIGKI